MNHRTELARAIRAARSSVSDCAASAIHVLMAPSVDSADAARIATLIASAQDSLRKAESRLEKLR